MDSSVRGRHGRARWPWLGKLSAVSTHLTQLAVDPFVPRVAEALVTSCEVLAGASMQAWLRAAFIYF